VLTPAGRASARARAARAANLQKARAAQQAQGYPQTEKRQAASRANLERAIAARRSPAGNAAARLNALKHGLFTRLVPESVARLAEDPQAFEAHRRQLEQVFAPEDNTEQELLRRLAATTWRRLRLCHAQARWEADRLREFWAEAPRAARLSAQETERRAYALVHLLNHFEPFFTAASRLESQIERTLRQLLRQRSGGAISFKVLSRRRDPELDGPDAELSVEEIMARLRAREIE
jgi:hypothetical protein